MSSVAVGGPCSVGACPRALRPSGVLRKRARVTLHVSQSKGAATFWLRELRH